MLQFIDKLGLKRTLYATFVAALVLLDIVSIEIFRWLLRWWLCLGQRLVHGKILDVERGLRQFREVE